MSGDNPKRSLQYPKIGISSPELHVLPGLQHKQVLVDSAKNYACPEKIEKFNNTDMTKHKDSHVSYLWKA